MKKQFALSLFCLFLVLVLISGCSLNYEEDKLTDTLGEEVPDTVLFGFVQTKVTNGIPEIRVYGSRAESYGKKKQTILSDVLFQEYDKAGDLITEGKADSVVYYTESEDAEIRGNIDFYSKKEDAGVSGEYLYWNNEEDTLSSKPATPIRMEKKDGTYIEGKGFSTKVKEKSVVFSGDVQGLWVDEED